MNEDIYWVTIVEGETGGRVEIEKVGPNEDLNNN